MCGEMTYSELYTKTLQGVKCCRMLERWCGSCPYIDDGADCADILYKDVEKMEKIMEELDKVNIEIGRF